MAGVTFYAYYYLKLVMVLPFINMNVSNKSIVKAKLRDKVKNPGIK